MTLTRDDLKAQRVGLNWKVEERHHTKMSLLDLLQMADMNEESWTNEDGSIRFATVDEVYDWLTDRSGPLDDNMFLDHLYEISGHNTWTDGEVDSFDVDVDLLPPEAAAS